MPAPPVLETARLRLRGLDLRDFDHYAAMWAQPGVVRFIGGVALTREEAWARLLRQIGHWHALGFGYFALEDRATREFLGEAGFQDAGRELTPSIGGTMEAGWVLAPAAQGRGLAEEAMRALLRSAGDLSPPARLTCIIRPDHAASLHVAGKLGFREFARTSYKGGPMVLLERPAA